MSCTICFDDTKELIYVTSCYHDYHLSCFNQWKTMPRDGPVTCCTCRTIITDDLVVKPLAEDEVITLRKIKREQSAELAQLRKTQREQNDRWEMSNKIVQERIRQLELLRKSHRDQVNDLDCIIRGQREEILELHSENKRLNEILVKNKYHQRYDFPE